jgi:hypothetical protein
MANIYVDQSGNDTTGTGAIGAPYATPGKAAGVAAANDVIYLKYNASPYLVTTATANVAGGTVNLSVGNDAGVTRLIGYDTNAIIDNTDANRPTIKANVGSISVVKLSNFQTECRNVIVDCNSQAATIGFDNTGGTYGSRFANCKAIGFTSAGFSLAANNTFAAVECEATGGTSAATAAYNVNGAGVLLHGCTARGNACPGFLCYQQHGVIFAHCLADSNTGASSDGFRIVSGTSSCIHCTARNNGRSGFFAPTYMRSGVFLSCVSYGNAAYGFNASDPTNAAVYLRACGGGSNTSGNTTLAGTVINQGFVTLSADPFTSGAAGDLTLNTAAGGGASLRAAGFPGTFPGGLTIGRLDIGAAQHADPAGGASVALPASPVQGNSWNFIG